MVPDIIKLQRPGSSLVPGQQMPSQKMTPKKILKPERPQLDSNQAQLSVAQGVHQNRPPSTKQAQTSKASPQRSLNLKNPLELNNDLSHSVTFNRKSAGSRPQSSLATSNHKSIQYKHYETIIQYSKLAAKMHHYAIDKMNQYYLIMDSQV